MNDYNEGHRNRVKEKYLKSNKSFEDYEILELILMYSIPRKDVKPIAKDLLNHFKSLQNVFSASIDQLMHVKGVGQNTAILLSMHKTVEKKLGKNKNESTSCLKDCDVTVNYCKNLFCAEQKEKIVVVNLDNSNKIIASRIIAEGTVNMSEIKTRQLIESVMCDSPAGVIVTHNHPNGKALPSSADISFTLAVKSILKTVEVNFLDHVIVGENEVFSMRSSLEYLNFFVDN